MRRHPFLFPHARPLLLLPHSPLQLLFIVNFGLVAQPHSSDEDANGEHKGEEIENVKPKHVDDEMEGLKNSSD